MTALIIGLIPLIIFAIVDTQCNLKTALWVLGIATIIECLYTIIVFGHLDAISLISIACVVILAIVSYQRQSSIFIKLKPAILNGTFGLFMVMQSIMGTPLFLALISKYPQLIPVQAQAFFQTDIGINYLSHASTNMGIALMVHAGLVAYAGIKTSNFWWGVACTLGFLCAIVFAIMVSVYQLT